MSLDPTPRGSLLSRLKLPAGLVRQLEQLTPTQLGIALIPLSVLVMGIATCAVLSTEDQLPAPGPPPAQIVQAQNIPLEYTATYFTDKIKSDAKKVGTKISFETLRRGLPYRVEFDGAQTLRVGRKLQTKSLTLLLGIRSLWLGGGGGQGIRARHLTLSMTNKLERPIAYRVHVNTKHPCRMRGPIAHNAMALLPGKTAERSECLQRDSKSLDVIRVEILELTTLGYEYVSRIDPVPLGFDSRTYEGHTPGGFGPCTVLPWRKIRTALTRHDAEWRDIVDFYARHNCDGYHFSTGYRWQPEGPDKLPAVDPPPDEG